MNETEQVKIQQKIWADRNGIDLDQDNYVKKMRENFFLPLSGDTIRDLKSGDGAEFKGEKTRTKIFATHSSSALVCNVFEYWRYRNKSVLAKAMKLGKGIKTMCFEQKLSMGMKGSMPNLDIFMILEDGEAVAVESKFTEWMSTKTKTALFAESYFKGRAKRWSDVGLPNCQKMAEELNKNPHKYQYLNAPQLLKHALGLANMHSNRSTLLYLYYDSRDSELSEIHKNEIRDFRKNIKGELNFRALTYQNLFEETRKYSADLDSEYLEYLGKRYFTYYEI